MKKILIIDDYAIVRAAIASLMQYVFHEVKISEASSMDEIVENLHNTIFDLLVFNMRFPRKYTLRMVHLIKTTQPETPVLFLSTTGTTSDFPYFNAGIDLYLKKEIVPDEIAPLIRKMINDEKNSNKNIDPSFMHEASLKFEVDWAIGKLSDREKEIMGLLAKGFRPSQIKKLLNIQYTTISTLKARMFNKMQVSSVLQLFEKLLIAGHSLYG